MIAPKRPLCCVATVALMLVSTVGVRAWDYSVHRLVNELAVASLPKAFPDFVRQPDAIERIAFLSGEADRWRNTPDLALKHVNKPDHYIDIEDLEPYGLSPDTLPPLRYDFIAVLAVRRAQDPEPWAQFTEENDPDHTKELCGLLPWTISEAYSRLKSGFSTLNTFEQGGGTAEEISNAQQNILYVMGVMGHYVGDATQPLHTTKHYNGWVGENPNGYTTARTIHSWIDGGFWRADGLPSLSDLKSRVQTAEGVRMNGQAVSPDQMFPAIVQFIETSHRRVEPLYQLEKEGAFEPDNPASEEGRVFLQNQVVIGGQMLGDLWVSAWQQAPEDSYLMKKLAERSQASQADDRQKEGDEPGVASTRAINP